MIKVAQIIKSFDVGGAEVLLRETFENENFVNVKTDSSIIVLNNKRLSLLRSLNTQKIYTFNLFSLSFISQILKLYKFLKKNQYDIIHCHLPLAGIIIALFKFSGLKFKLVYSEHSIPSGYHKLTFSVLGLLYHVFDAVIFVSAGVKSDVDKRKRNSFFNYRNGIVISNGVNLDKFNYEEAVVPERITVGTIASFRKVKQLGKWIEIAKGIDDAAPGRFRFILVGNGEEMPNVLSKIDELQLKEKVNLVGRVYNTSDYYHQFVFFLMSSDWEGMPVALLEAMACGCVPVVTNVGGIKQLKLDKFGCKYDNIDTAIKYIVETSHENELLRSKKKQARKYVEENFSLKKQLDTFLCLYNSLIKGSTLHTNTCAE